MLANHTGIIDCGYRGSLIGALRWLNINNESEYVLEKNTRLLQICHPTLCRVFVWLVFEEELSNTSRGSGGFGSTGGTTVR
jgi:dUTPase